MAMMPASLPFDGKENGGGAFAAQTLGFGSERGRIDVEFAEKSGIAEREPLALDGPDDDLARRVNRNRARAKARDSLGRSGDDRCRQGMFAAALHAARRAAALRFVESGAGSTATTFGLPSVSVPVLSMTSVSIFSMRSSASAFLISTPACAPRPTPTMIDIGVARPSAQGQAMISTLTAATRPKAKRGSGPNMAQAANASSATAITAGTNQADT